jgi:hypothetical protein
VERELMSCKHAFVSDFKRASDGKWVCSGCGKVSEWTKSHSYYGSMGCRKCHEEPVIEFVACSEACMAKFDPSPSRRALNEQREKVERMERREQRRKDEIRRLKEKLQALEAR